MNAFHHVSLLTRYANDNKNFYTELLGLRFVKNTVNQDNHRMLHWYYGDYTGSPGSVVTFFVVPRLGTRQDNKNSLQTIGLKLPVNSLSFWENRLNDAGISFEKNDHTLQFFDQDNVKVFLNETTLPPLTDEKVATHTDIPQDKQIIGLASTEFHVPDVVQTADFFEKLLGWKMIGDKIIFNETEFITITQSNSDEKSHMGRGSMDHVAFAVKDDEALRALHDKAKEQGWNIEKMISRGYFKSLYIREPGGNRVEFATLQPGFTIDEPLETLGESFALPPFLQKQRAEIEANVYEEELKEE